MQSGQGPGRQHAQMIFLTMGFQQPAAILRVEIRENILDGFCGRPPPDIFLIELEIDIDTARPEFFQPRGTGHAVGVAERAVEIE